MQFQNIIYGDCFSYILFFFLFWKKKKKTHFENDEKLEDDQNLQPFSR